MLDCKILSNLFENSLVMEFSKTSKIIIMSDCHRGDGEWSDNFARNQNLYFAALLYYYQNGYNYIELGDGDELWENRSQEEIIHMHSDVFWLLSKFYKENRYIMIYGNHDMVKSNPKFIEKNFSTYYDESCKKTLPLFPNLKVYESLILKEKESNCSIFLVHGHQCDFFNYRLWKVSRFLVRYLWKPLEMLGVKDPTRAAKNNIKKKKIEDRLSNWANSSQQLLIAGHTHRPMIPQDASSMYLNDGSCVHPRCITGIELINGNIFLIKWSIKTRYNRSLSVEREVISGPVSIQEFYRNKDL